MKHDAAQAREEGRTAYDAFAQDGDEGTPREGRRAVGRRAMEWIVEWLTPSPQRGGGSVYLPMVEVERRE